MIEKLNEFKDTTWLDDWSVDTKYLLDISFDDNDPDFGVDAVPPEVRRHSQLDAIIQAAQRMKRFDIAEAAKDEDADPIKLYGMLQRADKIASLPHRKIDVQSKVLMQA